MIESIVQIYEESTRRDRANRALETYCSCSAQTIKIPRDVLPQYQKLAEAIGFAYKWNAEKKQYMHLAAIYTCTPAGRISHYLYGVQFETPVLKQSLAEARAGQSGTLGPQTFMFCFDYDPTAQKYSLSALKLMRAAGVLTVIVIASVLTLYWAREARRKVSRQDAKTQRTESK